MDGTPMGESACKAKTDKIPMGLGVHWVMRAFIVAPKVQYPLVVGIEWLCKHTACVNWAKGEVWLESSGCKNHTEKQCGTVNWKSQSSQPHQSETTSLPKEYRDLAPIFELSEADELLPHWKIDCAIELLPDHKLPKGRLYSMNPAERVELFKFIDKNLERVFIHPCKLSPHCTSLVPEEEQKSVCAQTIGV